MRRFMPVVTIVVALLGFGTAHAETVAFDGIFRGPTAARDCGTAKSAVTDNQVTAFCDHLAPETFQLITVPTSQVPKFLMQRAGEGTLDRLG